ncbi:uncharacterized protein LOC143268527 [Peromyscus maniculatus bairdii]|uniref:uncharacterized protein LOC143268527 n=1 Tax=Peromyscus maniculatus bairdii TaxID=230844 RepID=UPI003FD55EDC
MVPGRSASPAERGARAASPRLARGRRLQPGPPLRPGERSGAGGGVGRRRRRRASGRAGGPRPPRPRGSAAARGVLLLPAAPAPLVGRLLLLCLGARPGAPPPASPPPRLPLRPRRADGGGPQCPHRLPRPPRSRRRSPGPARVTSRGPSGPSGRACPACTALAAAAAAAAAAEPRVPAAAARLGSVRPHGPALALPSRGRRPARSMRAAERAEAPGFTEPRSWDTVVLISTRRGPVTLSFSELKRRELWKFFLEPKFHPIEVAEQIAPNRLGRVMHPATSSSEEGNTRTDCRR